MANPMPLAFPVFWLENRKLVDYTATSSVHKLLTVLTLVNAGSWGLVTVYGERNSMVPDELSGEPICRVAERSPARNRTLYCFKSKGKRDVFIPYLSRYAELGPSTIKSKNVLPVTSLCARWRG